MKKVIRGLIGFGKLLLCSVILTLMMSGAEIAFNAMKMAYKAIFYAATMNQSDTIYLANELKREALVRTNFFEVLAQAFLIVIVLKIGRAVWKKMSSKKAVD